MDGIYNTIKIDGVDSGRSTTKTATKNSKLYVQNTPATYTRVSSFWINNLTCTQESTPTPDSPQTITGVSSVQYMKDPSSSGAGEATTVNLGATIYGGRYNVATGERETTYTNKNLNGTSTESWELYNDGTTSRSFRLALSDLGGVTSVSYCKCSHAVYDNSSSHTFGTFRFLSGYVYFQDSGSRFADVSAFKSWLSGQSPKVMIVYPLATSTRAFRTPAPPTLYDNRTYLWSSSGDIAVTYVDNTVIVKRPNDFAIAREDIYAGEYMTCTGSVRADRIGWKYSDMEIVFDELTPDQLNILTEISGEIRITFDDSDGEHAEKAMKVGFTNTPTRYTLPNNLAIWKDVGLSVRFIEAHS